MDRCAIIATHHKAGTVWMSSTFRNIAAALGIRYKKLARDQQISREETTPPVIIFESHSNFRKMHWLLKPKHRIMHIIRDPRDIVISAMHYHMKSVEPWLLNPREEFGGLTYQAALNGLPDEKQRYIFEMQHTAGKVIRAMGEWNYNRKHVFECKYEDLMADTATELFARVSRHLSFSEAEIVKCRDVFWRTSLFGGAARKKKRGGHVRSGQSSQWSVVYDRDLGDEFVNRFDDVLIRLAYEPDNSWVSRLPIRMQGGVVSV